jgi:hypothetical protein
MNAEVKADTLPEKKEFWRWQENVWVDETKDWKTRQDHHLRHRRRFRVVAGRAGG